MNGKKLGGGISLRAVPQSVDEVVILEGGVYYREPGIMWRTGRLFLMNKRLVFCSSRFDLLNFFRKPFSIAFGEMLHARRTEGAKALLDRPGIEVRTHDKIHRFSVGIYGAGQPARWTNALQERSRSSERVQRE